MLPWARRLVRALIGVAATAVVLLVRPLTPGIIAWTALLALVAVLMIELLRRPPSPHPNAAENPAPATLGDTT